MLYEEKKFVHHTEDFNRYSHLCRKPMTQFPVAFSETKHFYQRNKENSVYHKSRLLPERATIIVPSQPQNISAFSQYQIILLCKMCEHHAWGVGSYMINEMDGEWTGDKPPTSKLQVQHPNHYYDSRKAF